MITPQIKANGKVYKAAKPKAKVWRLLVKFQEDHGENPNIMASEEAYDQMMTLLVAMFNNKEVDTAFLEEHLDFDELFDFFYSLQTWITDTVESKMGAIPSKNAGAADSS